MRYFIVSIIIHILGISFVWVGFSIPSVRAQNSFTYLGDLNGTTDLNLSIRREKKSDIIFDEPSVASFDPWMQMRRIEKPR